MNFFNNILCFVFDMDGVLTDGRVYLLSDGEMARSMNTKDGYALQLAVKKGYKIVIISGGDSMPAKKRLEKLGIEHVYMSVHNKKELLLLFMQQHNLKKEQVLFMGDDIPDQEAMQFVAGVACCPYDACQEIKDISTYISPFNGGMGAARDVIEKVLKLQNNWQHNFDVASK